MSSLLVGLVLDRFPVADDPGLYLTAVVLADTADHLKPDFFIVVSRVAAQARSGVRVTQYRLRKLEEIGFLQTVSRGAGRGRFSRYCIDMHWLLAQPSQIDLLKNNGANPAPFEKGANSAPISEDEKVQKRCKKGAQACAPVTTNHEPKTKTTTTGGAGGGEEEILELLDAAVFAARKTGPIKNEAGFRAAVRRRICKHGASPEDLLSLDRYRKDLKQREFAIAAQSSSAQANSAAVATPQKRRSAPPAGIFDDLKKTCALAERG